MNGGFGLHSDAGAIRDALEQFPRSSERGPIEALFCGYHARRISG